MLGGGSACLTGESPPVAARQAGLETTCAEDPAFAYAWHCNRDSELEQGLGVERDECDYDPCGLSEMDTDAWTNQAGIDFTRTNVFATDGRRKAGADDLRTGWRFCRCTDAADDTVQSRDACKDLNANDGTGDCAIDLDGVALFDSQVNGNPWHPMRLTKHFGGAAIGGTTDVTYDGPGQRVGGVEGNYLYYPELKWSIRVDWDIDADADDFGVDPVATGYDMPGVMWTHAAGPTGEGDFPSDGADPLKLRTSNYVSGWYGLDTGGAADPDLDIDLGPIPMPRWAFCRTCSTSFPRPYLRIPDCLGLPGCADAAEIRFESVAQSAAAVFASGAQNGLGQVSGKWIAATEPDMYQGTSGIRYAAIATNGTQVNSILTLGSSGLSRTTPSNNGTKPSSRSLFGTVASVAKNRVWVMGGINGAGSLLQDLYAYNVATQTWSQVSIPGSHKPSRVLAAAYAVAEDRLLVLDQVSSGGAIRLLRIDPNGSASAQLVGTWSRTASTTKFGLSAEPGHRAYVVACGGSSSHAVLRFRRSGTGVTLWTTSSGSGALASDQLQVSVEGLSFLQDVNGNPMARGVRYRDMSAGGSATLCF